MLEVQHEFLKFSAQEMNKVVRLDFDNGVTLRLTLSSAKRTPTEQLLTPPDTPSTSLKITVESVYGSGNNGLAKVLVWSLK